MPFKSMGLADPLVQGILATGYTAPTEIQSQAIPMILEGKDIIGCAQTGTGKTAAFVLPMLHRLETVARRSKKKIPRALVITPTRELAVQIEKAIRGYGRFMRFDVLAVYGGMSVNTQEAKLRRGLDVVVATPGRLLDHMRHGAVNLSMVEMLVLDEADRMFDMGFIEDVRKIIDALPAKRQTLLFSATMRTEIQKLTESIQRSPVMIQIGQQHNPIETVTQHVFLVPQAQKTSFLLHLLARDAMDSVLIFSRTKRGADRITMCLKQGDVEAVAIHSDRTQRQRLHALEGFKRGKYRVLVATDVAARGIDVEGISHVINYDVPEYAEDYIHRIGRTGRATATGDAMTFVSQGEVSDLRKIESFIERTFVPEWVEDFKYTHRINLTPRPQGSTRAKPGPEKRRRIKAKAEKRALLEKSQATLAKKKVTGRHSTPSKRKVTNTAGSKQTQKKTSARRPKPQGR